MLARRRGFTLIEFLVVVFIIGVLIALVLPAVQDARNAARRAACSNNLRQIGIALHSYESAAGTLPGGSYYSFHALTLPYLEQGPLFNSINFSLKAHPRIGWGNQTAYATQLEILLCPSDRTDPRRPSGTSYAGNRGVGFDRWKHASNGLFVSDVGSAIRLASIIDGTSTTAACAEWSLGREGGPPNRNRTVFRTPLIPSGPGEFEEFTNACRNLDISEATFHDWSKGENWLHPGLGYSGYNHTLCPNMKTCQNDTLVQHGAWSSGSQHVGGAHVLFADGHLRFIREGITLSTWRALGTRNGGEAVSSSDH